MSVGIYYTAKRSHPLTDDERATIQKLIVEFGDPIQDDELYEGFTVYEFAVPAFEPREHGVIFSGSTSIKTVEEHDHWISLLSKIRPLINESEWSVHLDGDHYLWDDKESKFFHEPPPPIATHEVIVEPSIELEPEQFVALAAASLNLPCEATPIEIAERVILLYGNGSRILFVPSERFDCVTAERFDTHWMYWGITGKLLFPGIDREWSYSTSAKP